MGVNIPASVPVNRQADYLNRYAERSAQLTKNQAAKISGGIFTMIAGSAITALFIAVIATADIKLAFQIAGGIAMGTTGVTGAICGGVYLICTAQDEDEERKILADKIALSLKDNQIQVASESRPASRANSPVRQRGSDE